MVRKLLLFALLFSSPAHAYDWNRIERYCAKTNQNTKDREWCQVLEISAAKTIDDALKSSPSPEFTQLAKGCVKRIPAYTDALPCVTNAYSAIRPAELSTDQPSGPQFDSEAYCNKVAATVGGSYQIYEACLQQENEARNRIGK